MVPLIIPVEEFRESPDGTVPLVMVNVNGSEPPVVEIPVVTGPTAIPGMAVDKICTVPVGLGFTMLWKVVIVV